MANERTFNCVFDSTIMAIKEHFTDSRKAQWFCDKLLSQKLLICRTYIDLRNTIKNRYMKNEKEPLDRHKCAAAFMIAVLYCIDIEERNYNKEVFCIFVGMLLLKIFIRKECRNIHDNSLVELINKNNGLLYPPCVCDKNGYLHNWTTEMFCARKEGWMFVLSVSNNLFMIETYNIQYAKIKNLESEIFRKT